MEKLMDLNEQSQSEKRIMLGFVLKPSCSGDLDIHKQAWLNSLGLADDKCVIDCDPIAETLTYDTEDGPLVRQVSQVWSRVMGYHRPTTSFNVGKRSEHAERKPFEEKALTPYAVEKHCA